MLVETTLNTTTTDDKYATRKTVTKEFYSTIAMAIHANEVWALQTAVNNKCVVTNATVSKCTINPQIKELLVVELPSGQQPWWIPLAVIALDALSSAIICDVVSPLLTYPLVDVRPLPFNPLPPIDSGARDLRTMTLFQNIVSVAKNIRPLFGVDTLNVTLPSASTVRVVLEASTGHNFQLGDGTEIWFPEKSELLVDLAFTNASHDEESNTYRLGGAQVVNLRLQQTGEVGRLIDDLLFEALATVLNRSLDDGALVLPLPNPTSHPDPVMAPLSTSPTWAVRTHLYQSHFCD